ncbi:MAG TPA: MFS transporter [Candidatus Aminicenantes bacterium]|nr:MFS transporter [Candidatus Aminicenantes bacterium]HRY64952.1 MFS transporter [Candidatus Aminicenantes bacterium]HRZ71865.1 MFS transporter [Candidatus Aminicenantes bacterium]
MTDAATAKPKFPATFWTANTIELFERAAYYSMASFMVIYLKESLGMSPSFATFLNGSLLWGIIYFMPILSGTLADKFGFKRSLSVAFVLISIGYFIMGNVQRLWPGLVGRGAAEAVDFTVPVVLGIVLIGLGGSIVKPCIAGTVQKTAGTRATLAFGVFYMVINIGSITGRSVSYFIRTSLGIPAIFTYAATAFALIGLVVTLFIYREPEYVRDGLKDGQEVKKRTLGQALGGIFVVLGNLKFVFLILVLGLFWFLYIQLYNLMPLFMRFVDPDAPMELYTLANPVMIVCFQLLITRLARRWLPVKSIMIGAIVVTLGMLVNVLPPLLSADAHAKTSLAGLSLPVAGIFMIISIASMAVGEMMASPRIYEYIGAIAPKGQEGLYLGYSNLPIALASIVGGPIGGRLFERYVNTPLQEGRPVDTVTMWLIIVAIGALSVAGLWIYDRVVVRRPRQA